MAEGPAPAVFKKSFTRQEPIPEAGIARALELMRSGRLHRYDVVAGEEPEAAALEREFAAWQGARYCLACTSGGFALQLALRCAGIGPGDPVLANAFTLAPVPGAIDNVGARPVLVEIDRDWHIDLEDLEAKAGASGASVLLLSHMRGHSVDMTALLAVCERHGLTLIEDCAHTMGARWAGTRSGSFGRIAGFSTQAYKHLNSGEGGLLTTDDPDLAARAILHSGSYMHYRHHGAIPAEPAFEAVSMSAANYSGRMDNLRAALLRAQLPLLEDRIARWNRLYRTVEGRLRDVPGIRAPSRDPREQFVGSSFQFGLVGPALEQIPDFLARCAGRGVALAWFGANRPHGYTSRFDDWRFFSDLPALPRTTEVLARTLDLRLPLTFDEDDARIVASIIREEAMAVLPERIHR